MDKIKLFDSIIKDIKLKSWSYHKWDTYNFYYRAIDFNDVKWILEKHLGVKPIDINIENVFPKGIPKIK